MKGSGNSGGWRIKVGVITDQTGPLSFMGIANANMARMVIDDINANGGLLGRPVDLYLEDSETTDSVAEARAKKLVRDDQVDVILGGIYSSTRQARPALRDRSAGRARRPTWVRPRNPGTPRPSSVPRPSPP
jgi:ABC-type branched-subunit amino acid transport system substrate-binding protein